MGQFNTNFNNASLFTFDANLIEFSGSVARLKDLRPATATFFADYASSLNGNWGGGTLTASNNGGVLSGGRLQLTGGVSTKYLDYVATNNASSLQVGCVRMRIVPNYSGTPATNQFFFRISQADGSANNVVSVFHATTTGQINFRIFNSAGANIMSITTQGLWVPVSGTTYEFEFNWDITTGATRLFIDGVQFGITQTATGTRSGAVGLLRIGEPHVAGVATNYANFSVEDIVVFSNVQHIVNYTPGAAISSTIYSIASPTIYKTLGDQDPLIYLFTNFADTLGSLNQGIVGYELSEDGVIWKYWNGSAWVVQTSNQYNTEATVNANIDEFPVDSEKIYVKVFFISDGNQKVEIESLAIGYVDNIQPLLEAGIDKSVFHTFSLKPFSDSEFTDPDGDIVLAEYKVDGENDWTEILQGSFGTLLEAVQDFSYEFNNSGAKTVRLRVTDDGGDPEFPFTTEDSLTVTVNELNITFTALDEFGNHISDLQFLAGDDTLVQTVSSPFTYSYDAGIYTVALTKTGYIGDNFDINLTANGQSHISYMAKVIRLSDATISVEIPNKLYKGNSFIVDGRINQDISNWKFRCELSDGNNSIQLASVNVTGGSEEQVIILDNATGLFRIVFDANLTTDFSDNAILEIEAENVDGEIRTFISKKVKLIDKIIDWTEI